MEQVIGQVIVHKIFGRGIIVNCDQRYFTVRFDDEIASEKRFLFPDAFASNITFEDEKLQEEVMAFVENAHRNHQQYTEAIVQRCRQEALAQKQKKIPRKAAPKKRTVK